MTEKKSDFKRFCETMWIMVKYDILPLVVGIGLYAAYVFELKNLSNKNDFLQQERADLKTTFFQKQR